MMIVAIFSNMILSPWIKTFYDEYFFTFFKVTDEQVDQFCKTMMGSAHIDDIIPGFLYLGDICGGKDQKLLDNYKITHIINCAKESPNYFPEKYQYHNIELKESAAEDVLSKLNMSYNLLHDLKKKGEKVFIHCLDGINRSPTIIIGYFIKENGWDYETAMLNMKKKRVMINPSYSFSNQLKEWAKRKN